MKTKAFSIVNRTRNTVIASRVYLAADFWSRLQGCLGRTSLAAGEGLYLTPCMAVHALGMTFPVDAVSIDRHGRVRRVVRLQPWHGWLWDFGCQGILELPAGSCQAAKTECRPDDQLAWRPENGW